MSLLDTLLASDAIDELDAAFARALGRRVEVTPEVLVAAALASRAVSHGHAAVDLADVPALLTREHRHDVPEELPVLPEPDPWVAAVGAATPLVRGPDGPPAPLVLDGTRLYLDRVFRNERALGDLVTKRAATLREDVDEPTLLKGLAEHFGEDGPDLQRQAAETAIRRGFTVIAGGPGTGKTVTVRKIVALVRAQAEALGARPPRVVMVAPSGKAAARLTEAVQGTGVQASTIHRALGLGPHLTVDDPVEPLVADLVVVDEASMVDLALMTRLLRAVPERARLVLLGDPDQLASVEHGSVLADVCAATGPVAGAVVRLERSYRFAPESGIARLARAINAGDADRALDVLTEGDDARRVDAGGHGPRGLEAVVRPLVVDAHRAVVSARTPADALRAAAEVRILCAHRHGAWGAVAVAERVKRWLAAEVLVGGDGPLAEHQPVMVLENDDRIRLYNGDTGLLRVVDGELRAVFPGWAPGEVRTFAPARLPRCEPAFASTVHKAQGSEYGHVVVVLPDVASAVVTRELLYTAVTRATRRVTVVASEEVVRAGVAARMLRVTGLRERVCAAP